MKDSLAKQCLDILKREDVQNEFKLLLKPVLDFILYEKTYDVLILDY